MLPVSPNFETVRAIIDPTFNDPRVKESAASPATDWNTVLFVFNIFIELRSLRPASVPVIDKVTTSPVSNFARRANMFATLLRLFSPISKSAKNAEDGEFPSLRRTTSEKTSPR